MTPPVAAPPSHPFPEAADTLLARRGTCAENLLDALGLLVRDPRALSDWLRFQLDDPDAVRQIAARSYWHANGFAKLVLHVAPSFRIRLHIWPAGDAHRGETNPHSHRWDFASSVLVGDGLITTEYEECADEECADAAPFVRHRYARGVPDGPALYPVAHVGLRPVSRRPITALGRYATEISKVHTVEPIGSCMVATLVVQGPHRADSTVVYCAPGAKGEQQEMALDTLEIRLLVDGVLADLDRRGDSRA